MAPFVFLGVGAGLVPVGLIILVVFLVVGGRNEPDPDHHRPTAVYYALVQFIAVFVVLFSAFALTSSLLNLTTDDQPSYRSEIRNLTPFPGGLTPFPDGRPGGTVIGRQFGSQFQFKELPGRVGMIRDHENDADYANAARAAVVLVLAGALYLFHERRRPRYGPGTPGRRVYASFLYAVSLVSVLVALGAAVAAIYSLLGAIAPGIFGASRRTVALREFFQIAILAIGAGALFWRHLRKAEPAPPVATEPPPRPPAPAPAAAAVVKKAPAAKKARAPRKRSTT